MRLSLFIVAAFAGSALAAAVQSAPNTPNTPWVNTAEEGPRAEPAYDSIVEAIEDAEAGAPIEPIDISEDHRPVDFSDNYKPVDYARQTNAPPSQGIGGGFASPNYPGASRVPSIGNSQRQPTSARTPSASRQRDETAVKYNLRRVNQALVPLETALQRKPRYWRTPTELDDYFKTVWDMGNVVVQELGQGAADIRLNAGTISDPEALGLQRQVSAMDTSLTNVITAIIASKRDVDQIYRRKEVLDLMVRAEIETNAFVESIVSKLSGFSQVVGQSIKSKFVNNINRGIRDYRR